MSERERERERDRARERARERLLSISLITRKKNYQSFLMHGIMVLNNLSRFFFCFTKHVHSKFNSLKTFK